jgi:hypothetical protein
MAIVAIPKIPSPPTASPGVATPGLDRYVGQSVEDFCEFHYGEIGDEESHCAHFVCHAIGIQVGRTCESLLAWKQVSANIKAGMSATAKGYTVRVNELYNSLTERGDWAKRTADPSFIFATLPSNITVDRQTMGGQPKKHVGYFASGTVWHYGNTDDEVKKDSLDIFQQKFKKAYGSTVIFLYGSLPSTTAPATNTTTST